MIYAFIVFLLILCVYTYDIHENTRYKYTSFYSIVFILILLNVLSYKIGGDTETYMYSWKYDYRSIFDVNLLDEIEYRSERPGWILLTSFLKGIWDNFILLRIVLACWLNLVVAYFIKKNTRYIFTVLLIYFVASYFNYNFEILRESISISFFLLAFSCYLNKSWLKYSLCFLVAFMFHESSLVLLLLPFFYFVNNLNFKCLFLFVFVLYLFLYSLDLVNVLLSIVGSDFAFYEKFISYMNSSMYGENSRVNSYAFIVASVLTPLISLFILKHHQGKEYLAVFVLISIVFSLLTSKIVIFYRFNNYMQLPLAIAYAEVIHLLSSKFILAERRHVLFIPILLFYLSYKVFSVYLKDEGLANGKFYDRYFPYSSIVDKNVSIDRAHFMDQLGLNQIR
ncbi:EpsG family protein [Parabacteroides distasonis]|uniref:EpsG family protein n=1 Tax=Parabacteroides distasonis TaxID=823 RepID=UPI003F26C856